MITLEEDVELPTWLIVKKRKVRTILTKEGERIWLDFPFNRDVMEEIKSMKGAKWHGYDEDNPVKRWSVEDCGRNRFQLAYLSGLNPYARYDKPLMEYQSARSPYKHQLYMTKAGLTYHYIIIAGEMGVGKTLSAIEIMEHSGYTDWWWVGPKSALNSTRLELSKWQSKVYPELYTYEQLKKVLENWPKGKPPPHGIVVDECSRVKNPTAQRSEAVEHLAEAIREYWGETGYVIEMSGSPAPKSPGDWWNLCEIACPGFIKEGTQQKFIYRLAITQKNESVGGGFYNTILGWKDDVNRCVKCAKMLTDPDHRLEDMAFNVHVHAFEACTNEVSYLYERMKGLVHVVFKKDCLDLPDKQYRLIKLKPDVATANAAKIVRAQFPGAAQALVRLRELSDGFQYDEEKTGTEVCSACKGAKEIEKDPCITCSGRGVTDVFKRTWTELPTPKEEALVDLLDEHEEVGRLVVYAAFTASVDRVVQICRRQKWEVVRVDGRGWQWIGDSPKDDDLDMLKTFQREGGQDAPKVAFVGHPGSAGMGLTLTASPSIVYFSNDFNAENRIQSEDRIHRPGMDTNRGATIIDLIHLPTDRLVLENLKKKRDLQAITLGDLKACLEGNE